MVTRIIAGNAIQVPQSISEITLKQADALKDKLTFSEFCRAFFDIDDLDNLPIEVTGELTEMVDMAYKGLDNTIPEVHSIQIGKDIVFDRVRISAAQHLDILEVLKRYEGKTLEDHSLIKAIVQIAVCREVYGIYSYSKASKIQLDNLPYVQVMACGTFFLKKSIDSLNTLNPMSLLKRMKQWIWRILTGSGKSSVHKPS